MALRRLLRPFLKAVHPDFLHQAAPAAKRANEQSLQQLNTIIDTLEHLGGYIKQGNGDPSSSRLHSLEPSYELTFHLASSSQTTTSATGEKAVSHSFTTRLSFPPASMNTLIQGQAAATAAASNLSAFNTRPPGAAAAGDNDGDGDDKTSAAAAANTIHMPLEIKTQLRKLFQGARLSIPRELEGGDGTTASSREGQRQMTRSRMISKRELKKMMMQDLMGRDLKILGTGKVQKDGAVDRLLASGRVMTKGISMSEELLALQGLRMFLLKHYERIGLEDVSISSSIILILDAEAKTVTWEAITGGKHMITCPHMDLGRTKLALVLRQVGKAILRPGGKGKNSSPVGGSYQEVVKVL